MPPLEATQGFLNLMTGLAGESRCLRGVVRPVLVPDTQFATGAAPISAYSVQGQMGRCQSEPTSSGLVAVGVPEVEVEEHLLGDILSGRPLAQHPSRHRHDCGVLCFKELLEVAALEAQGSGGDWWPDHSQGLEHIKVAGRTVHISLSTARRSNVTSAILGRPSSAKAHAPLLEF